MLRQWFPRHWRDVNKRGQALLTLGLIWLGIGIGVWIEPNPTGWEHIWLFHAPPLELRAGAWLFSGLFAMAFAVRPEAVEHDGLAFGVLIFMPIQRVLGFLLAWLDYVMPWGGPGYSRGLLSAVVWVAIVVLIRLIASWPNPPLRTTQEEAHE